MSKFFLNLEKFNRTQSQICKIRVSDQEITDRNKVLNEIRNLYESLFQKGDSKPPSQINDFLDKAQLSKLTLRKKSGPHFSRIFPKNADQNNAEYGHILRSVNITETNKCDNELTEK